MAKKKNDYALNLEEKIEMVRMSVRAVTRGYKISRTIIGCLDESTQMEFLVNDELYNKIISLRE